ncbi:MAG: NlpC/P60 family protein, partial [Actinomycetota bacterium]
QHGVSLPHNAAMQFNIGVPVPVDQLQPGDLVFWGPGNPHHVAMYIGQGRIVEAPTFNEVVKISNLDTGSDYAGARRYPLRART